MKKKSKIIILSTGIIFLVIACGLIFWWQKMRPQALINQRQKVKEEVFAINPRGTDTTENIPALQEAQTLLDQYEATDKQTDNQDAATLRQAADNYYLIGQLDKAIETYLEEAKLNPNDGVLYRKLGDCYKENLAYEKAIEIYKKSIALQQQNNFSYYSLADIYKYNLNNPTEAKKVYQALLDQEPDNQTARTALETLN